MKRNTISYLLVILGLLMFGVGLYFVITLTNPQGIMLPLPYVLVGVGCGIFGHSGGELLRKKSINKYPDMAKQLDIESKDERNVLISNRAKAKTYDIMIYVFGGLMLLFILMSANLFVVLLLVCAYIFMIGHNIYFYLKYMKEM